MTTFTSEDREKAYEKIVEAAPYQPGYEDAVPVPPVDRTSKELTDEEITEIWYEPTLRYDPVAFARAILRKAQEK